MIPDGGEFVLLGTSAGVAAVREPKIDISGEPDTTRRESGSNTFTAGSLFPGLQASPATVKAAERQ